MPKAVRHIGIFCMPANSTKIKFRFPERWPKKLNYQAERREFVKQKFNVSFYLKTHLIFANMRVGRAAISGGSEHND